MQFKVNVGNTNFTSICLQETANHICRSQLSCLNLIPIY